MLIRYAFLSLPFIFSVFADPSYEKVEDKSELKVLTPQLKNRQYSKLRLSNGLEVFLVSDPETKESAAALSVEAGSWQDPKEYPGMAHFLEHMLFMGTSAYPEESEYLQYIRDHGGKVNAYTASDSTVYGFSTKNTGFLGALDRFAHFFIDPLFSTSCIDREFHAIDQEFAKNIENDSWRTYMVLKESGNPDHPNRNFSTGNAETLNGIPQEALRDWYANHYSANRMHLVAISPLPIDEMADIVEKNFLAISNRNIPSVTYPDSLFSSEQKGSFIYIKPIKDIKEITLIWEIPKNLVPKCSPSLLTAVCYALSNGTQNGLIHRLKRDTLAEKVSVSTDQLSKETLLFEISITLTDQGLKSFKKVLSHVHRLLNFYRTTDFPDRIFQEVKGMTILDYEYQSRSDAFASVMTNAAGLLLEDLETFPQYSTVSKEYDAHAIEELLAVLRPETCVYFILADPQLLQLEYTQREKWTGVTYLVKPVEESLLLSWKREKPSSKLGFPSPNPYIPIPAHLDLSIEREEHSPIPVVQEELGKIFMARDSLYSLPKTTAILALKNPLIKGTAKATALFDLFLAMLNERLSPMVFYTNHAGLFLNISQQDFDFIISVTGYTEKIPLCLKTIFQTIASFIPTQREFHLHKESVLSKYANTSKELSIHQGMGFIYHILCDNYSIPIDKYNALKEISFEEFEGFCKENFTSTYLEGLFYGDLPKSEMVQIYDDFKLILNTEAFKPDQHYKKGVFIPGDNQKPFMFLLTTERQGNSTILVLHEGAFSPMRMGIQQILSQALQDDFFKTLRTKQQTGYIAAAWDLLIENQLFELFAVQSITHDPQELVSRFELFLETFCRKLELKIPLERFEVLRSSLIESLNMIPEDPKARAKELHKMAFQYGGDFDWIKKRLAAAEALSYDEFVKTAKEFLSRRNFKRWAVLVQGSLPEKNQFKYEIASRENLLSIGQYIKTDSFH